MLETGHVQRTPRAADPDVSDVDVAYPRGARPVEPLTPVQVAADKLTLHLGGVHVLDVDVLHVATTSCVGLDVQAVPEVRRADPAAAHVHVAHPAGQLAADGERAVLHHHGAVFDDHVPARLVDPFTVVLATGLDRDRVIAHVEVAAAHHHVRARLRAETA